MFNLQYMLNGIKLEKIILLILLMLIYTLFLFTGDIQEDAFIIFRSAFNLANHGNLTYNLGEDYSGVTSYLYPFLIALIRLISGEHAITVVLIVNSVSLLFTSYFFTRILGRIFDFSNAIQDLLWFVLSISPVTILMATRGMEATYVSLLIVVGLYKIQDAPSRISSLLPVFILPFVRPDAIAFSLILTCFSFSFTTRIGLRYLIVAISSAVTLALAYYLTVGTFLPNTVYIKGDHITLQSRISLQSLLDIVLREFSIYFRSPLFTPIETKYFVYAYPFFTVFALGLSAILLYKIWCIRRPYIAITVAILAGIWLVPGAYGIGDVVFPWYFWPSRLLFQGLLIAGVLYLAKSYLLPLTARRVIGGLFLPVLLGFVVVQLALSYSKGAQESVYRASVGKYIASLAKDDETLYLEPAGIIPFFAKIKTFDTMGLVSKMIVEYRLKYPILGEIEMLKQENPTFIVLRGKLDLRYPELLLEEKEWIKASYEHIRTFKYIPEEITTNSFLQKILKLGTHSKYNVYKFRESP